MSTVINIIKSRYKYSKTIYRDMYGLYRYGYGHYIGTKVYSHTAGNTISRKEAEVLLTRDIERIRKQIVDSLKHLPSLKESHLDLMTLLFYDIGEKSFFNSRFFMFYYSQEYNLAFKYFEVWKNVLGVKNKVAEYRRNQELKLIKEK